MPRPTGLHGSFELDREEIARVVSGVGPGAYALGYRRELASGTSFIVQYVGRSDTDLARRLGEHADEAAYMRFKYGFLGSSLEAFQKESFLFHEYGEEKILDNKVHPRRPINSSWKCPFCQIFG